MNNERYCIVINRNAGSADQVDALLETIQGHDDFVIRETQDAGHAIEFAHRAVEEGFGTVVAAGGDGTINEVVNGMLRHSRRSRLGIIPLGTGNDLARTLCIPQQSVEALELLKTGRTEPLDAMQVTSRESSVFGINVAAGGFSGAVDEVLTPELKSTWGPLAYVLGAVSVLPDLTRYHTVISYDNGAEEVIQAINVIVANGRTAAGGKRVAPPANPQDGLLDVVIVQAGTLLELTEVGARLLSGNYIDSKRVFHRRARQVHVSSSPGMWFNVDGELLTSEPVTFTALPGVLDVIVGPDFTPEG